MFHSRMPDLIATAGQVLISCEPRLVTILRPSFLQTLVFQSDRMAKPDWREHIEQFDFRTTKGSLPRWFRRNHGSFQSTESYLKVDPLLSQH